MIVVPRCQWLKGVSLGLLVPCDNPASASVVFASKIVLPICSECRQHYELKPGEILIEWAQ